MAAAGLMLYAGQASAHAFLKTATPAVGSTVQQPPNQVVIDFTEGVEPKFSTITVQDASGSAVQTGGRQARGWRHSPGDRRERAEGWHIHRDVARHRGRYT